MTLHGENTDRIRQESDVLKVIGHFVKLRRAGREHVGLCPLHKEKTPSFYVNPAKQTWHCQGCGAGGDIFTFIQRLKGLDFVASKKFLAEFAGLTWEARPLTIREKQEALRRRQDVAEMGPWRKNLIANLQQEERELLDTYYRALRYLTNCKSTDDPLFDAAGWTVAKYERDIQRLEDMREEIGNATNDQLLPLFRQSLTQEQFTGERVVPIQRAG